MKADGIPQRVRVLSTGGEWPAGLALLRGLRDGGFEPLAAVSDRDSLASHSRAPADVVVIPPPADPPAHSRGLAAAADELGATVVLPGSDASLVALAAHRDGFGARVRVGVPSQEAVRAATDKRALEELSARAGLRTPATQLVRDAAAFDGGFPAVVKPSSSIMVGASGEHARVGVSIARDREELAATLRAMPGGEAVVQPYVEARLRTVNGVAWNGEVVCSVHKRSDRTWPPEAGIFAYGRTVAADAALEAGVGRLLAEVGWSGLFNLQFLETRTGEALLIDLNPRAYHSLALATRAGANLAAVWCDLLLGRPPRPVNPRVGVRFRSDEEELRAVGTALRARDARRLAELLVPRRRTAHALFELRDPGPLLHTLRRWRS